MIKVDILHFIGERGGERERQRQREIERERVNGLIHSLERDICIQTAVDFLSIHR